MNNWLCEKLQWFCSNGGGAMLDRPPPVAPEIDSEAFSMAVVLVIGLLLIVSQKVRRS